MRTRADKFCGGGNGKRVKDLIMMGDEEGHGLMGGLGDGVEVLDALVGRLEDVGGPDDGNVANVHEILLRVGDEPGRNWSRTESVWR